MQPGFDLARFQGRWRVLWRQEAAGGVPAKPGAEALHARLRAGGVPCAVATSSAQAEAALSLGGRLAGFGAVVTGDQVANGKPAPDIYLEAARRLGVAPGDCLALEDSDTGARSALAAGMRVVVVPDLVQPSPAVRAQALLVAASLDEAAPLVLRLAGIAAMTVKPQLPAR